MCRNEWWLKTFWTVEVTFVAHLKVKDFKDLKKVFLLLSGEWDKMGDCTGSLVEVCNNPVSVIYDANFSEVVGSTEKRTWQQRGEHKQLLIFSIKLKWCYLKLNFNLLCNHLHPNPSLKLIALLSYFWLVIVADDFWDMKSFFISFKKKIFVNSLCCKFNSDIMSYGLNFSSWFHAGRRN